MSPLRLLILIVLLYILFRLLTGGKKRRVKSADKKGRAGQLGAHDVLVEDPVCHTYVPKKQAVVAQQGDTTYFFCSEKCRDTFLREKGES